MLLKTLGFRITLKTEVQVLQWDELKWQISQDLQAAREEPFTTICNHFSELVKIFLF